MSTKPKGLATTLFGKTRRRILALLFGSPGEEFYVREIVRATASSPGAVQRELTALESAGIVRRRARGNQVFYAPNQECPIYAELRDIMLKTAGLADVLRRALSPMRESLVAAFVFGSLARGEGGSDSDVDLMVIGQVSFGEVVDCLQDAQQTLGREVNPLVQSPAEFRRRVRQEDHFLMRILEQPLLFVLGGPDELGELGAERLVGRSRDQ